MSDSCIHLEHDERNHLLYLLASDLERAKWLLKMCLLYETPEFKRVAYDHDRQHGMPPGCIKLMDPKNWFFPDFKIRWQEAYAAKVLFEKFAEAWPELMK